MKKAIYCNYNKDHRFHALILERKDGCVLGSIYEIEDSFFSQNLSTAKTGIEVDVESSEMGILLLTVEVWEKYYFTNYTNNENQLYHKRNESDTCQMEEMFNLTTFAYKEAMKVLNNKKE